ncbi:MAG: polysaccharide biosynthesis tyrosine autokinase [Planctomycetota bacterium]
MDKEAGPGTAFSRRTGWNDDESGVRDLLRVVFLRRWILVCALAISMLGAAVYLYNASPVYRASALVLIEMSSPDLTRFQVSYDPPIADSEFNRRTFLETQYQILVSRPLVEKTFHQFELEDQKPYCNAVDPVSLFQSFFFVTPIRKTQLAHVSFESRDPWLAAEIVDYHVEIFREDYEQRCRVVAEKGLRNLRKKAAELEPKVEESARALQRFKVTNNMISLDRSQDIIVERMKEINRQLIETEKERIRYESMYQNIERAVKEGLPLEEMPEIVQSATIRDLKLEYVRARQESDDLGNRFGPNHPEVQAAAGLLSGIQEKMKLEIEQALAATRAEFERVSKQEASLLQSLEQQQGKVMELNQKSVEYSALEDTNRTLANAHHAVNQRIEEVEITLAAGSKESNIVVVSKPRVPVKPVRPRKLFLLGIAALAGLVAGALLCYVREYFDASIKTKKEVERFLDLPVAGTIPRLFQARCRVGNTEDDQDLIASLSEDSWVSAGMQSFQCLDKVRTNSRVEGVLKTVVITSPTPGEGKSLISINLAIAMARAGKRVLIVDADLRRPRLSRALCPGLPHGLSSLLARRSPHSLRSLIFPTEVNRLYFLPSGCVTTRSCRLLASPRMAKLLHLLERSFDCILLDTPPLAGALDAAMLSRHAQAVLLVIRAFKTQRNDALSACESLLSSRCPQMAAVLNTTDAPWGSGGNHAGYYYTYYPCYEEFGQTLREHEKQKTGRKACGKEPRRTPLSRNEDVAKRKPEKV